MYKFKPAMKKLMNQAKDCREEKKVFACSMCSKTEKCSIMLSINKQWSKK